ncbi:MAG TPA: large-conductance mechanosensitive channel protein MscL [Cytophagaceae bacterium]|jgi:large conductance mechanosensitive channel|nr:large-conductance mechanosensitive channel protein MscL [Cytophagaceae bacterium]
MGFFKEFKDFAMKGNVVDMAVGVIIGAAFNKIVDVFVKGIMLPPLGLLTEDVNFQDARIVLEHEVKNPEGKVIKPENAILWGNFVQDIIVFIITAFAVFLLVKGIQAMKRKQAAAPETAPEPTLTEKLLMEIRDSLKK